MTKRHTSWPARPLFGLALVLAVTAGASASHAQSVAPNAAPQGGTVVGGVASISRTPSTTQINQGTNRAIINWQSFNVGQNQSVNFQQPSSQSLTLNRVTGSDMSVIAGRVTANGGVALVNQSGVFFAKGAQVQAQSVIVSTADINNQNFMAGGAMKFDQPGKPDASVVNDGSITVRQAGLAALVAPQVANHGVIQARLGTVVLAGAERHVIDLNGDGLVSFDVTGAVRQAPNTGAALVTNTGVIRADGGSVQLTAAAADGIVQDLVRAGGRIQANSDAASGTTGRILLEGTGGSISVAGDISAQGRAAGTHGGTVGVLADRVQVESTARINASGRAGGGTVAIGTSPPGAGTSKLAQGTGIARGAVIKADATATGNGGHVVVNASRQTAVAGSISARGGPSGGDGGLVEVSSQGAFALSGPIDTSAPAGHLGSVVLDPATLTVVADGDPRANVTNGELTSGTLAAGTDPGLDDFITPSQIGSITGLLTLQATNAITVSAAVVKPLGSLALQSGGTLAINAPITIQTGDLQLSGNAIAINDTVTANTLTLTASGELAAVTEGANGAIVAGTLTQTGAAFATITLGGANRVGTIATLAGDGAILFHNTTDLQVTGAVTSFNNITIATDGNLVVSGTVSTTNSDIALQAGGNLTVTATGAVSALLNDGNEASITLQAATLDGDLNPTLPGSMTLAGSVTAATAVTLGAGTGGITQTQGTISGQTLTVQSGGDALIDRGGATGGTPNSITVSVGGTAVGDFEFDNGATNITVPATINAGSIGLRTTGTLSLTSNCPVVATSCEPVPVQLNAGTGRVSLRAAALAFATGDTVNGGLVELESAAQEPLLAGEAAGSTVAGSFMVNQDILAAINATTLRLGAATIRGVINTTATSLGLRGAITLVGGLDLRSLGDITQTVTTPFNVGTISGAAGGSFLLTAQTNTANQVGDITAATALQLNLGSQMSILGTLTAPSVVLGSTAAIGETDGGKIVTPQLTVSALGGSIALGGDNDVAQLNTSNATGDLGLNDVATALVVPTGTLIQPGGSVILANTGDITINGTVNGTSTVLNSDAGTLTVNGHSAIARTSPLVLSAPIVVTTGLIQSPTTIFVSATSATLGGQALGQTLDIYAPSITFNSLDAHSTGVMLLPGTNGVASGTLQAKTFQINGGSGATLLGSINGVTTGAAAALGVRASSTGVNLGNQPPNAAKFTFNGCPIAVVACQPVTVIIPPVNPPTGGTVITTIPVNPPGIVVTPPIGVANSPSTILATNNPRRFDPTLTNVWLSLPTPPPVTLFAQPARDPGEELELAPPNVRAEDF